MHGDRVEVIVQQAYLAFDSLRPRQSGAALVHPPDADDLVRRASCVWLANASFEPYVRPYGLEGRSGTAGWTLPSPLAAQPTTARGLASAASGRRRLMGHFGTFNPLVTAVLAPAIVHFWRRETDATWLLIGRGGERFAAALRADAAPRGSHRRNRHRFADSLSAHVLAADVFVQPYPDESRLRRTTLPRSSGTDASSSPPTGT